MTRRFCASTLACVVFFLATAPRAAAQTYKAETFSSAPPSGLATAVSSTLGPDAVRVVGPKGPLCEIWWRKGIPVQGNASQSLGIVYGQLAEGTLVGAIRFPEQVSDYRQQHIKPGVYTLRYALIPVDGNHQGVAPNRDFLLLSPAAADSSAAVIAVKELLDMSRKASGTGHPSVWSLVGTDGAPGALPGIAHQEDTGNWTLYFRAQLQQEDGSASPLPMGMVVVGHAPEA